MTTYRYDRERCCVVEKVDLSAMVNVLQILPDPDPFAMLNIQALDEARNRIFRSMRGY